MHGAVNTAGEIDVHACSRTVISNNDINACPLKSHRG